jgi:hypothetical protein
MRLHTTRKQRNEAAYYRWVKRALWLSVKALFYSEQPGRLDRGTAILVVEDDDVSQPHCYQCDRQVNYLFPDGRCSRCTRVQPD